MGFCISTDTQRLRREAGNVRERLLPRPEEEAGWTTEEGPKGLEVLEPEHSSGNVLAQYLHNLFKLHFSFKKFCVSEVGWGKRRRIETKTNQFPHM